MAATIALPFVNICIPAYNAALTLEHTLRSLLVQQYPEYEIIVSDNHSTDSTAALIRSFAEQGVRYCSPTLDTEWLVGKPRFIGAYHNANFVVSQASGEYLCLYHADDLYAPDIVYKQAVFLSSEPDAGAVFTMLRAIGDDGQPIRAGTRQLPPELSGHRSFDFPTLLNSILRYGNFLPTPSVMLRKSVFEEVGGFNEQAFRTSADLELWLRIAQRYAIGIIDEPLLNYRMSPKQYGSRYNRYRTTPADFFHVIDHFLAQQAVQEVVSPQARARYELNRSADLIECATSLLAQERVAEAQDLLHRATVRSNFATAVRQRSKRLVRLMAGAGLLGSSWIGLGPVAGRRLQQMDLRRLQQLHMPLVQIEDKKL